MAGKRSIDWEYWRHKYVSGSDAVTFEYLASQPNAPKLNTLKKRSMVEAWVEQRRAFRNHASTKTAESATTQQAVAQVQQMVDAAEVISRHLRLSRAMQSIASKQINRIMKEVNENQDYKVSPSVLVQWINAATALERLTMGMVTERTEVNVSIDFANLSDEQLERLATGADPAHVLN